MNILMPNATDGILSLTATNAEVPCRLTQSFTTSGVVVHRLESTILTSSKVSVRIFLKARFGLNKCARFPLGEAYTGWNSVSRIMIEEVPPPQ